MVTAQEEKEALGTRMFALEKAMNLNGPGAPAARLITDAEAFMKFLVPPKSSIVGIRQ
jgi:hypothetical protein